MESDRKLENISGGVEEKKLSNESEIDRNQNSEAEKNSEEKETIQNVQNQNNNNFENPESIPKNLRISHVIPDNELNCENSNNQNITTPISINHQEQPEEVDPNIKNEQQGVKIELSLDDNNEQIDYSDEEDEEEDD